MIIEMINTSKEMFTSDFILTRKGEQIGEFHVKGRLGSIEGEVEGRIFEDRIRMKRCRKRDVKKNYPNAPKPDRPYEIWINDRHMGYIYDIMIKTGWFTGYTYHKLFYDNEEFESYGIGLGEQGSRSMLFHHNIQFAEIASEAIIYNDLHHYKLWLAGESHAMIAVLKTAYGYVLGAFHPGAKAVSSVEKRYHLDTNKERLSRYDPDFIKTIEE